MIGMTTRNRILGLARAGTDLRSASLSKRLGISRQTIAAHLKHLVDKGLLEKSGSTHNAAYRLARPGRVPKAAARRVEFLKKNAGLEEDRVFQELDFKMGLHGNVPANVYSIAQYAITEIVNNSIEHSGSSQVRLWAQLDRDHFRFEVRDWGIGVYRNVMNKMHLKNELDALEHVFKGKQTTMPDRHSGEGIFFTSRIADVFKLRSHREQATIDNTLPDTFVREERFLKGTLAFFVVRRRSKKTLQRLFEQYTNRDLQFDRNVVRVRLSEEKGLLSRSQARRLIVGLDKYRRITFDFQGVKEIGQSFADEIFRVFAKRAPHIHIDYANASPAVEFMIKRAKARDV